MNIHNLLHLVVYKNLNIYNVYKIKLNTKFKTVFLLFT